MGKRKWLSIILIFAVLLTCLPMGINSAEAATTQQLRQIFDTMDKRTNSGNWYKNNNNESNVLSWNQSYVMASYVTMYEATGDTYYLDRFVDHADSVLKTRDSVRGVKDYRGLSTPSWRTGGPNYDLNGQILNDQYYIMGVNTGMVSYSFAEFAAIVYNSPALSGYKSKAAVYLQAAKDAVAVHDYEWVDNGSTGYYVFKKGAPYWTDGANLPHNQYLALARTQLAIYQATGDKFYYNRVQKMAQLFKSSLTIDQSTGAYIWHYQWGKGLNGWTTSDNLSVNKPSYGGYKRYEDVSHGAIDVDFAYKAYQAGIVFTEQDMVRFGKTLEKYVILPNGKVAQFVNGGVEAKYQIMIAHWLRISKYAPSAYPLAEKLITSLTGAGGTGMLAIAMTNLAANGGGGVIIEPKDPVENPPEQPENPEEPQPPVDGTEIIINGGFENNRTGWSGNSGTIQTESNGNKFLANGYNWQAYQDLRLQPGEYRLSALTKKMTAAKEARITVRYGDANNNYTYDNLLYAHKGTGWEKAEKVIKVPAGTTTVRLYLLINGGTGEHGFDQVSLQKTGAVQNPEPPAPPADTTAPEAVLTQPGNGSLLKGTVQLTASATDNLEVTGLTFEYSGQDGQWTSLPGEKSGASWTAQLDTTALADGVYNLRAAAVDAAGNKGTSEQVQATVDNTAPEIKLTVPAEQAIIGDGKEEVAIGYSLSENSKVNLSLKDSTGKVVTTLQNGVDLAAGDQKAVWNGTVNGSVVPAGKYEYEITAVDAAGNNSAAVKGTIEVKPIPQPEPEPPVAAEQITNGGFNDNRTGWSGNSGTVKTESNGNKYLTNGYNWQAYQDLNLAAGEYKLTAATKKLTATTEARIVLRYTDAKGNYSYENLLHAHKGTAWETAEKIVNVPAGTTAVRLYLLVNGGKGEHAFDNISLTSTAAAQPEPPVAAEQIINSGFNDNRTGWSGNSGTVKTESNGNKYLTNGYNWQAYQDLNLTAGEYKLTAATKKLTATTEARIVLRYTDAKGNYSYENLLHAHKGTAWETAEKVVNVPAGTTAVRLYLLVNGGKGEHAFDNVSLQKVN